MMILPHQSQPKTDLVFSDRYNFRGLIEYKPPLNFISAGNNPNPLPLRLGFSTFAILFNADITVQSSLFIHPDNTLFQKTKCTGGGDWYLGRTDKFIRGYQ